jgi:hypothetical protein
MFRAAMHRAAPGVPSRQGANARGRVRAIDLTAKVESRSLPAALYAHRFSFAMCKFSLHSPHKSL